MSTGVRGTLGIVRPLAPLLCKVIRTTDMTYTVAEGNKPVTWQNQELSVGGFIWDASVPTRLTAPVNGVYEVTCYNLWSLTTSSYYLTLLRKNGTTFICNQAINGSQTITNLGQTLTVLVSMIAGEYVEMCIAASGNNSIVAALGAPALSMQRVA